ncbi:hypothetical protein ABNM11_27365, partial [Pseudomonas syringae]
GRQVEKNRLGNGDGANGLIVQRLPKGFDVVFDSSRAEKSPPVFWVFSIVGGDEGKVGGVVMIDRLDGHVWGELEYIEYMYDYNNVL